MMRASATEAGLDSPRAYPGLRNDMCKLHRRHVSKRFEHGVRNSVGKVVGGDHVLLVNAFLADVDLIVEGF